MKRGYNIVKVIATNKPKILHKYDTNDRRKVIHFRNRFVAFRNISITTKTHFKHTFSLEMLYSFFNMFTDYLEFPDQLQRGRFIFSIIRIKFHI
jgi:hypothetical protein